MEGVSKLFRTSGKRVKPSLDLPEGLCGQFSLAEMRIATNTSMINYYLARGISAVYIRGLLMTVPESLQ